MSERLRTLLSAFDSNLPLERARTIPAAWYTDTEIAAAERRGVFGRSWIFVGRLEQVTEPGSYFACDVAGEPIVAVRGRDGVLRAFFNVCRHKAAVLLSEPCGQVSRLRCRYHGWTYDLAGQLRGTPEFDGVADFRREDNGLMEVAVATYGPLVAVCLEKEAASLAEHLNPVPERVPEAELSSLRFAARKEYEVNCNWKIFVDNYLDGGYHVNTVHPALAGMLDYSKYRTETFNFSSVQTSPLDAAGNSLRPGQMAQYWYVFPNFMMNLYGGLMDTNVVFPLGPDRCRVIFDFYFAREGLAAEERFQRESMDLAHEIQLEDMEICEEVQRGLGSRSYNSGRFSVQREKAAYHFHQLLARKLQLEM
ncbi:MAG TPA: aromatic ring-hydroxylating dioxygenase subunit alpha [Gemmataceae bacterium]|jgi:choline monooxygenase|nr:aromatic ring-hydroxylating dioxygenase subunit alpha [Gemmataceae bacterium]